MKKKLVIFGAGDIAQLAHYYFRTDSDYEVVAFAVDEAFRASETFSGLPLVNFQGLSDRFAVDEHAVFVALSYAKINALRKQKYLEAKAMGYPIASYVSSRASVLDKSFPIGENCFILEDNTIQPFARIGNNVTLWSGNHIGHHSTISDHSFVASHVVISGGVHVGEQCFIGVNATLRDHVIVGDRCVIGAGALILVDAEPDGVYIGAATERSRVPSSRLKKI